MDPFTQFAVGTGLVWIVDRFRERKAAEDKARADMMLPEPVRFSEPQINSFTRADGPSRVFDVDLAAVTLALLSARSLAPVTDPRLAQPGQQAWRVVPLTPGLPRASDVIAKAFQDPNAVVLGSLSLSLLPIGSAAPMVIMVGGPQVKLWAMRTTPQQQGGDFAILRPPPVPTVGAEPEPVPAPPVVPVAPPAPPSVEGDFPAVVDALAAELSGPSPRKRGKSNGVHREEAPPIIDTSAVETRGEG